MPRRRLVLSAFAITSLLATPAILVEGASPAAAVGVGTFTIFGASTPEGTTGAKTLDFVVALSNSNATEVSVSYTVAPGTAKAPLDYTDNSGVLVVPALATTATISVPLGTDSAAEPNEAFTVTLFNPEAGMTILDDEATGTILNDDGPAPAFSVDDASEAEGHAGGSNATFTVNLSAATTLETSVHWATSSGTATAGTDYATSSGDVTLAAGVTSGEFTVSVLGDTTDEVDETFTVTLSAADDATISDGAATGTITDDDAAPSIIVDDPDPFVEGDSGTTPLPFTVSLSAASGKVVTVDVATGVAAPNPATAGTDYVTTASTVTFVPGDTSETVNVTVNGDVLDEQDEIFALDLSNPLGDTVTIPDPQAIGTIANDEDDPLISVADATASEGNSGTSTKAVTVTLSPASGQTVTVDYTTVDGTATQPGDYTTTTGTVTFVPGDISETFNVSIAGDTLDEADETVAINLSNPTQATIADGAGVLTITDDDATPSLLIDDKSVAEGNTETAGATFTVTLSAVSGQNVTVNASTADGTATAGVDYAPRSNVLLTIPAGSTTASITVDAYGDLIDEPDETATVQLSGATNATIADANGSLTITDDDNGPGISIDDVTNQEGNIAYGFTVTLGASSAQTVTVEYTTQDMSATQPSDYTTSSGTLTFTPGQTSKPVTVNVIEDAFAEGNEVFLVALSAPAHASLTDGTGVGTINNDDGPPATVSIANDTSPESESAVFMISLPAPATQNVTVDVTTIADGTATTTTDYDPAGGTRTITVGSTSTIFTVPVTADNIDEPDETFTVNISNATNAVIGDGSALGTITDDDATPSISIADDTVGESAGPAELTVTLSNPRSVDVTVDYSTANGTATADDYTSTSGTLTIDAGDTTGTIDVPVTSDDTDEPDETVAVTLANPTNATINDGTGVVTITDDDNAPSMSIGNVTVAEGDSGNTAASFTVTLSGPSGKTASATAASATGTASATDFTAVSGPVTFVPGDTTETVVVQVAGDTKAEINELFTVALSAPSNATIGDGSGNGTITDDDGGGTFTAVTPARILDTRNGTGTAGSKAKVGPGQTIVLDVTGLGGVPATGVDAVVINTTVTQPTAKGFLSVTPDGTHATSSVNFVAGQTIPNLVTVKVHADGKIRIYNSTGSSHVIGDIVGWYATDASTTPGSHFVGLAPARVLDTRDGTGRGGSTAKVGAGQTIVLDVTGFGGVPATNVSAVVINTTVTQPTTSGFLSVTPDGTHATSNVNFTAGETVPNLVVVPVGSDGKIRIYNSTGSSHIIGDVVGWYTTPGTLAASVFEPLTPARVLDTRDGTGQGGSSAKVGAGQTIVVDVTGFGGVPSSGVAAVVMNTTVTQPTANGFVSVTPDGTHATSNINFVSGETVPNLVVVAVGGDGSIRLYNSSGTSHLIGDLVGWFTTPAA